MTNVMDIHCFLSSIVAAPLGAFLFLAEMTCVVVVLVLLPLDLIGLVRVIRATRERRRLRRFSATIIVGKCAKILGVTLSFVMFADAAEGWLGFLQSGDATSLSLALVAGWLQEVPVCFVPGVIGWLLDELCVLMVFIFRGMAPTNAIE